jgi:hypothetical protein
MMTLPGPLMGGSEEQAKATTPISHRALDFDASRVPPPDDQKGKAVARAFDEYLYPKSADANSGRSVPDPLIQFIWRALRNRYMEQHKITATAEEVEKYVQALEGDMSDVAELSKAEKTALKTQMRQLAARMIKQWKTDKMLYEQYGGAVEFRQLNPLEPVGAYRAFLQEMERAKVFEIFDEEDRKRFWNHFEVDESRILPPRDVDFGTPWWLMLPQQGE